MTASPSFDQTFAHPNDPLGVHLATIADAARGVLEGAPAEVRRRGAFAGLLHDLGKGTRFFQDYMLRTQQRTELTPHAALGAWISLWVTRGWDLRERLDVFVACLRHHGNLRWTWAQELSALRDPGGARREMLRQQLKAIDLAGVESFLRVEAGRLGRPVAEGALSPEAIEAGLPGVLELELELKPSLVHAVDFLAGFGAMLAEDKTSTALRGGQLERAPLASDLVERYRRARFGGGSDLDQRRAEIAAEVEANFVEDLGQRRFTLTSPTGSGKTLAILNAALKRRARGGVPARIVYCLPFTSVIDQNFQVFEDVLACSGVEATSDVLLKHHHQSDGVFRTAQAEHAADGAGSLLTETWRSELVVTTFHQLLHALLSGKNRHVKRVAQLTNAIVLLDEVQALPLKYWRGVGELLETVSKRLNTTFVLLTATRPWIFREGARELLPSHPEHFAALSRVRVTLRHREETALDDFVQELAGRPERARLVILNRKRAVRDVVEGLRAQRPEWTVRALSTWLTPRDRLARIREIAAALAAGARWCVVSTQLVEAGVDLSFPEVHRDLAPLDALVQSCGRCNRHGEAAQGEVTFWQLKANERLWTRVYDSALIGATRDALGEQEEIEEREFLGLVQRYFELCEERLSTSPIVDLLAAGKFEELREEFRLIDERKTRAVFVVAPGDDGARELWRLFQEALKEGGVGPARDAFKARERAFFERVVEIPWREGDPEGVVLAPEGSYDEELGLDPEAVR